MDIVVWLRSLGLEEYEAAFRDNKINERVLPNLTQEDLKEIGVVLLVIAGYSSMPLLLCVPMGAQRRLPETKRLQRLTPVYLQKTAPSAAKLR